MKQQLLFTAILLLTIFSCKNDDEINPNNKLEGKWEFKMEKVGNNYELDFVNTLEFKVDGTVYGEGYTINSGTDQILGYRYYFNGKYTVEDGKVIINQKETFQNIFMDTFYSPKEDLIYLEEDMGSDSYLIKENYTKLQAICPPNANCVFMEYVLETSN